jgi:hypothetical protein
VREQSKILSSVSSTRASARASARTTGSFARGVVSATADTLWPAARRAVTTAKSQLSSARNRTRQSRWSGVPLPMKTTSS